MVRSVADRTFQPWRARRRGPEGALARVALPAERPGLRRVEGSDARPRGGDPRRASERGPEGARKAQDPGARGGIPI